MILVMLIFGNLAMTTRLPTRKRGRATVHASAGDEVMHLNPESIPKVNYKTFLNPAYCVTTVGAACVMMGIGLPVSCVISKHNVIRDNVDRGNFETEAMSANGVMWLQFAYLQVFGETHHAVSANLSQYLVGHTILPKTRRLVSTNDMR